MENLDKQRFVFCLGAHFGLSPSTSCYSIIPIILVGFNATRHMLEHTQLVLPMSPDVLAPLFLLSLSLSTIMTQVGETFASNASKTITTKGSSASTAKFVQRASKFFYNSERKQNKNNNNIFMHR